LGGINPAINRYLELETKTLLNMLQEIQRQVKTTMENKAKEKAKEEAFT
jgi:hypothetical protein